MFLNLEMNQASSPKTPLSSTVDGPLSMSFGNPAQLAITFSTWAVAAGDGVPSDDDFPPGFVALLDNPLLPELMASGPIAEPVMKQSRSLISYGTTHRDLVQKLRRLL